MPPLLLRDCIPALGVVGRHGEEGVAGLVEGLDLAGEVVEHKVTLIGAHDEHCVALAAGSKADGQAQGAGGHAAGDQLGALVHCVILAVAYPGADRPDLSGTPLGTDRSVDRAVDRIEHAHETGVHLQLGGGRRSAMGWRRHAEDLQAERCRGCR